MKKIVLGAALLLAMQGCTSPEADIKEVNKFLTDLSQVYVGDFKGPNPDDFLKADFAVKRLFIDSPEVFEQSGADLSVSADKVHAMSDKYFDYPIKEDQSSNDVDYTKDGKYVIMPFGGEQYSFSKATLVKQKGDTLLYDVDVYNCASGWAGDINASPADWAKADPDNVPEKYKTMRAVLVNKSNGLKVVSYMVK